MVPVEKVVREGRSLTRIEADQQLFEKRGGTGEALDQNLEKLSRASGNRECSESGNMENCKECFILIERVPNLEGYLQGKRFRALDVDARFVDISET